MIKKRLIIGTLALVSIPALAAAQEPRPQGRPQTSPTTTLQGCLYREAQVPGRTPNVVERAGILEDYILVDAMMPSGQARPGAAAGTTGTSGTMPATGNMYKVEGPPDERLKALVGKKVEVMGRIDPEGAAHRPGVAPGKPTPDLGPGPDHLNLPEFEASSIRAISGTCPATPAPRK